MRAVHPAFFIMPFRLPHPLSTLPMLLMLRL